jgi:hypothetical protein
MSFITSPGVIVPPLTAGGVAYGTGGQAKVNNAGIAGQALLSGGAGVPTWGSAGFALGMPVTVSGSSVSITGIPATAKQIVLMFKAVRSNAAVNKFIQLGDSSGFITSGYVAQEAFISSSSTATDSFTNSWRVRADAEPYITVSGAMTFTLYDASTFTYVGSGLFSYPEVSKATTITSGFVTLTSILTQLRVSVTGTTFDTGSINVAYI